MTYLFYFTFVGGGRVNATGMCVLLWHEDDCVQCNEERVKIVNENTRKEIGKN